MYFFWINETTTWNSKTRTDLSAWTKFVQREQSMVKILRSFERFVVTKFCHYLRALLSEELRDRVCYAMTGERTWTYCILYGIPLVKMASKTVTRSIDHNIHLHWKFLLQTLNWEKMNPKKGDFVNVSVAINSLLFFFYYNVRVTLISRIYFLYREINVSRKFHFIR